MHQATATLLSVLTLAFAAQSTYAQPVNYQCTADRHTVGHSLDATVDDGKVSKFSYMADTPVEGSINTCSLDSNGATESDAAPGVQAFSTSAGEVRVMKKGKKLVFDFSKLTLSDLCGQSSTIAMHITLTPGSHHCTDVANFD